jgi:hypothetical protein
MNKLNYLFISLSILSLIVLFTQVDPIEQDPEYHNFADTRTFFGIPNFFDVVSNIPFFLAGFYGIYVLMWDSQKSFNWRFESKIQWWVLFTSSSCIAIGSSYYHWTPNTSTLFWDRLPMTVSFMSIVDILLIEKVDPKLGKKMFLPLLGVGVGSLVWWAITEYFDHLHGDLRLYVLVQSAPILMTPIVIGLYPNHYTHSNYMLITCGFYAMAKIAEYLDHFIFSITFKIVSGHTLKHLIAGAGLFYLPIMLKRRTAIHDHFI